MSDLLKRLRAMRGDAPTRPDAVAPSFLADLPASASDTLLEQAASGLGAQLVESEAGLHFVRDVNLPADARHGTAGMGAGPLHPLLLRQSGAEPGGRVLYLDTETTGLSGGTGTLAFLIGVGAHSDQGFSVRQLLLPGPEHERSQLLAFAQLAEGASAVITYNGGSFDLPLLRNRFALAGLPDPLWQVPHLDLLTLSRRLWRNSLPDCSLGTVERHILGAQRHHDDVPGAEVPLRYLAWLRNRRPVELSGVLGHNATDIVALTALRWHVERLLSETELPGPSERHGLGLWLDRLGETEMALEHLQSAARTRPEAAWHASLLLKRAGRWPEAAEHWRALGSAGMAAAWVELAKLQEHRQRDFTGALESVEAAATCSGADAPDLERRRKRLLRRQSAAG